MAVVTSTKESARIVVAIVAIEIVAGTLVGGVGNVAGGLMQALVNWGPVGL